MGTEIYCDYCGVSVPIADSAYPIIIGKNEVARVCVHCSGKIENLIKTQKNNIIQSRREIMQTGKDYLERKANDQAVAEATEQPIDNEAAAVEPLIETNTNGN